MALRIKSEGTLKSSRHWSCSTLHDGVDMLLSEARQADAEEENLLQLIEDPYNKCFGLVMIGSTHVSRLSDKGLLPVYIYTLHYIRFFRQDIQKQQPVASAVPHLNI